MERAAVIGASGGIGQALAAGLDARGVEVVRLSRSGGFDVTDEGSVAAGLAGGFDMVLVASGGLGEPEKQLRAFDPAAFAAQVALNAAGPLLVLKHAAPLMPRDRRAVFAALSARVGSIGDNALGGWYSYRAAKAALNQLVHTAAIEFARTHPEAVCVTLHPGTVATRFTADYAGTRPMDSPETAAGHLLGVLDGLGPEDTGGFFDQHGERIAW